MADMLRTAIKMLVLSSLGFGPVEIFAPQLVMDLGADSKFLHEGSDIHLQQVRQRGAYVFTSGLMSIFVLRADSIAGMRRLGLVWAVMGAIYGVASLRAMEDPNELPLQTAMVFFDFGMSFFLGVAIALTAKEAQIDDARQAAPPAIAVGIAIFFVVVNAATAATHLFGSRESTIGVTRFAKQSEQEAHDQALVNMMIAMQFMMIASSGAGAMKAMLLGASLGFPVYIVSFSLMPEDVDFPGKTAWMAEFAVFSCLCLAAWASIPGDGMLKRKGR